MDHSYEGRIATPAVSANAAVRRLTDEAAHRIAEAAIEADRRDRELFEFEKTGARLAIREARRARDKATAQLTDAIAEHRSA